ncbi:BspA family leucine-rich repeat surface protein [Psychroflexus planctonicus]|uniref:Secretion system C-terminal sorting domain-containing protein n=1 Tax=Psychroflexus planctonicus TaxID=1526575 RepID=A0ABQ1SF36_9FLAO|nr:BspA family leucine-rich repeat surface protein [Psychroflexus planctonicus]GGE35721.1 hypothetical protein GCM10010832_14850 [Psychroflexus planctonicus]
MKKYLFFTAVFFAFYTCLSAQEFITTWATINSNSSITFEVTTDGPVSYTWQALNSSESGSGSFEGPVVTLSDLPINQNFSLAMESENLKAFKNVFGFFAYRLKNVSQWGDVEWETMEDAFVQIESVTATDIPNLSNCTSLKNMFKGSILLNSPFNINFWDVSNITNMSGMFQGCRAFNQALSQWDVSSVTNMSSMFQDARLFNQNIGSWNTSNVVTMRKMFKEAQSFDRNINNWNTENVTDMSEMFFGLTNASIPYQFNKNLGDWNTANVTNMSGMFRGAAFFNQDIGNWETSSVTDMSDMFREAYSFNQNIGNWDMANVTNTARMFFIPIFSNLSYDSNFNNGGSSSIENWDTSNIVNMSEMFLKAESFNYNLGNWNLNDDVDLFGMLDRSGLDCGNYSQTLIAWNNNPNTPNNKILGATFLEYGPEAEDAIENLVVNKGWGFSGHDVLSTIPNFSINNSICEGEEVSPLPSISDDGITGTWFPEFNSTETTTYTFTPNEGECALETSLSINVNSVENPTGEAQQTFVSGSTLADIEINPSTIVWYASLEDAVANTNEIPITTELEDSTDYFAVNDDGLCRREPFAITVFLTLSIQNNDFVSLQYFPNPVKNNLRIVNAEPIQRVKIYNLSGKLLLEKQFNNAEIDINLVRLSTSTYIAVVETENQSTSFQIIKR